MEGLLHLLEHHGYLALFVIVFLEAVGLPIPAAIALVTAGATVSWRALSPVGVVAAGMCGIMLGDMLLYLFGRKSGWWLLGLLCRVSMNPETCILRSAESFYRRGRQTLLFAKFIPGINAMAAPLAGSMKMRLGQFLRLDAAGTLLYVVAYAGVGALFSRVLKDVIRIFENFGRAMEAVIVVAVVGYFIYRGYLYWTHRVYRIVPRVQVSELVERLSNSGELVIADVRSHGYYDSGAERIKGSIRFEPNNLRENIKSLSKEKPIFLYCT